MAPTQEIYQEILRTRKSKKVIASLGSVAASGGLYVAAAADRILSNPATVTGSIGVIMQTANIEDLLSKVGLRSVVIKSGPYKDIGSSTRPMSEDERAILQKMVDDLHGQFVRDLAGGRGLEVARVGELADGRIFTGEQAVGLGLVDQLGNFEDAVNLAGKLGGLEGRVNLIYPKKKTSWWKSFFEGRGPASLLPEWLGSRCNSSISICRASDRKPNRIDSTIMRA